MVYVFISSILVILISVVLFALPLVLMKKNLEINQKMEPFECGFDAIGANRLPFSMQFFMIAIIFLVFDVEICLLLPLVSGNLSPMGSWFVLGVGFMIVLMVGLAHEWNQGSLDWKS